MKKILLEVCFDRLKVVQDCIENYESYYWDAETIQFAEIPVTQNDCTAIGGLLKECGTKLKDFELIGIGDVFLTKAEELSDKKFEVVCALEEECFDQT